MADTGMNVKVAVRVRPFNQREIIQNTKRCIQMVGNQTVITDPETGKENRFTYDYSYWSHDKTQEFADQGVVFGDLGLTVLNNAWQGFNTSIFAYGQTGSGKSYSMVGYGEDKGIVPRVCEEMFNRIKCDERASYRVEASMIEIYNEQVRDLFNPTNPLNKHGLKVRENPQTGPYVEGLESSSVKTYQEISALMDDGNRMRTIAKTNMNDTSSRAHTIFQIQLTQISTTQMDDGESIFSEKSSRINLIDLAGSERVSKTGATGDRLKEGASINVSLTTLGNVINKLAELSNEPLPKGKDKGKSTTFVPYRDSVLTWLLKDSLGGNSKTIMVAAISPSDFNYGETLSTLRYANRAKNIKNRAIINEDSNVAIIRELKEEVERLKMLLGQHENGDKMIQTEQERQRLIDELEAAQNIIGNMQMTSVQKEQRSLEIKRMRQKALQEAGLLVTPGGQIGGIDHSRTPHLFNLNEDPLLTGMLVYYLNDGRTDFSKEKISENCVVLASQNILSQHCFIEVEEQVLYKVATLCIHDDAVVYVNGIRVEKSIELAHGDRVIFGNNHAFRFVNPTTENTDETDFFDWSFAQTELTDVQGIQAVFNEKEREWEENWKKTKLKQLEEEFALERSKMLQNGFGLLPPQVDINSSPASSVESSHDTASRSPTASSQDVTGAHSNNPDVHEVSIIEDNVNSQEQPAVIVTVKEDENGQVVVIAQENGNMIVDVAPQQQEKSPEVVVTSPQDEIKEDVVVSQDEIKEDVVAEESHVAEESQQQEVQQHEVVKTPKEEKKVRVLTMEETSGMVIFDNSTGSEDFQFSPINAELYEGLSGKTGSNGSGELTRSKSFRDRFVDTLRRMQGKPPKAPKSKSKRLDKYLMRTLPLIKEANYLAKELKVNISYDLKIVIKNEAPNLYVQLLDRNVQKAQLLSMVDFENAVFNLREMMKKHSEKGSAPKVETEQTSEQVVA
jgi:hypothetical protein